MYFYYNMIPMARKDFIDGIIDDFIYEMVQSPAVCRTDVHTGAFSDRFKAFEHLYGIIIIVNLLFFNQMHKPLSKIKHCL